ncbi:MAG: hypothetical protein ACJA1G_001808 [Qipengyuania sp.]|jgi:hypothetical protein
MISASPKPYFVTPAQAGVQITSLARATALIWAPACAGATEVANV